MILMEKGASLSRRDYQGNTPCDKSAQSGDAELKMFMKSEQSIECSVGHEYSQWNCVTSCIVCCLLKLFQFISLKRKH